MNTFLPPPLPPPPALNVHFAQDVARVCHSAHRLQALNQRLASVGAVLPPYLYLRPLQGELVFTRPALPRLAQLFGREGWRREAGSTPLFDWVKSLDEGVTLRICECESMAVPTVEVSPSAFEELENL
jgi:hypothetical protein